MRTDIKINDLSFSYGDQLIFQDMAGSFSGEEITLITGANGSGKTTLCRLIMHLLPLAKGKMFCDTQDLSELDTCQLSEKIIYLKQNAVLNILAVTPRIDLGIQNKKPDPKDIDSALQWFGLKEQSAQPVWELSGGQMQRLALSHLILNQHKFWLLDEPAAGLDPVQQNKLIELLVNHRNYNGALIISHRHTLFANVADRIYEIKNKKLRERYI